jgi:probable F420-dependent oxidoreductase
MKLSIGTPHAIDIPALTQPWEAELGPREIVRTVRLVEDLGFDKVYCSEHFVVPESHVELSGKHYLNPIPTLAFLAGQTSRLTLGSLVTLTPLQHPIVQAKMWSVLDWLSGGRIQVVAAVGWMEEEYRALGVDFHRRGRINDEYVAAMLELWTNELASFDGEFVSFACVAMEPKPIQSRLPLWFAGDAPAVLRRVARWGDGWSPRGTDPKDIPQALDYIHSQPDYHGRPVEVVATLAALTITEDHAARDTDYDFNHSDPDRMVEQFAWLAGLGVTEVIPTVPRLPDFEAYLDRLRWLGGEVMPKLV